MSKMIEAFMATRPTDEPLLQPLAFHELRAGEGPSGRLLPDKHPLRDVKVPVSVRVGCVQLTVGELLAARSDAVLTLDRAVGEPVDLLVDGHVVARGELVAVDDRFGVRITELPVGPAA